MGDEEFLRAHIQVLIEEFGVIKTHEVVDRTLEKSIEMSKMMLLIEAEMRSQKSHLALVVE